MIDFLKITTETQNLISSLYRFATDNMKPHKPQNNYYLAFSNGSGRFRLEFRKIIQDEKLLGFRNVEICFSPHYIFNDDLHNGNDFTPRQCISVTRSVLGLIGIQKTDFKEFAVTNIEYGLNLQISGVSEVVGGILFTKKSGFAHSETETVNFKISLGSKYKFIKAYDKGLQFRHLGIPETFRFELKSKKRENIKKLGIYSVGDLMDELKYNNLSQSLLDEWEHILIINCRNDLTGFPPTDLKFIKDAKRPDFWAEKLTSSNRNKFNRFKAKYYSLLGSKFNMHHQIKLKIIDKLVTFSSGANCPQKPPMNRAILHIRQLTVY